MTTKSDQIRTSSHTPRGRFAAALHRFFRKDERGVVAIEFAMIAPPFLASIAFTLILGSIFLTATSLEDGVREAARKIRVGAVFTEDMSKSDVIDLICDTVIDIPGNCRAALILDVDSANEISLLPIETPSRLKGEPEPTKTLFKPGKGKDYVLVRAYLPYGFLGGIFQLLDGSDSGHYVMSSTTIFRSEPFN